ncbi:MAG: bacillithiol biosynthesis cysteine-adding enzyme BshC [Acidobacteriota bacterium]
MTRDTKINFRCIPKTSALLLDYLYQFPRLEPYFSYPYSLDSFRRDQMTDGHLRAEDRERLCEALLDQNRGFGAGERTLENIQRLKDLDCVAVVTGQQAGLFTGPAYTVHKALTAIKLSLHYGCRGLKAVPVFWIATEDHDVAEVDHCYLADENGIVRVHYESNPDDLQRPIGSLPFGPTIEDILQQFLAVLPDSEFKPELESWLKDSYRPGNTFGQAFAQVFSRLFSNYGLILLDPRDRRFRESLQPLFKRVLHSCARYREELKERNRGLVASGYHAQVELDDDSTFLFVETRGRRQPLLQRNGRLVVRGSEDSKTVEEVDQWLENSPEVFSPNVVLRPLAQDTLLPTLTYVAGPSEIAYLAQVEPLYRDQDRKMPIVFPRASFSVIERKAAKVLDKYRIQFCDVFQGAETVFRKVIETTVDQSIAKRFDQIDQDFNRMLSELEVPLRSVDPTLAEALKTTQQKVLYQVTNLRTKFIHAESRHHDVLTRQIERVLSLLYPLKAPQERRLNIFYFLSRYGMDFLAQLFDEIDLTDPDHRLLYL